MSENLQTIIIAFLTSIVVSLILDFMFPRAPRKLKITYRVDGAVITHSKNFDGDVFYYANENLKCLVWMLEYNNMTRISVGDVLDLFHIPHKQQVYYAYGWNNLDKAIVVHKVGYYELKLGDAKSTYQLIQDDKKKQALKEKKNELKQH